VGIQEPASDSAGACTQRTCRSRAGAWGWWQGLRLPGTSIPGVLTAGTFYQHDGAVFYDVHDPDRTIVIELDHEHYRRLVVEVADPAATVSLLEDALHGRA